MSSSSPTALRSFFGNGDTSDFPTTFSEGSGDLGLVCLTGVVTQRSGAEVDDEEDAPPGFGIGESGSGTSCISGLSDVLVASGAAGLGGGSLYALGIAGSGAFQMGSFLSPTTAFGGLPRVVAAVFHGVHSMSAAASVDQLLYSVSLLTVRVRQTPALLLAMCSSV